MKGQPATRQQRTILPTEMWLQKTATRDKRAKKPEKAKRMKKRHGGRIEKNDWHGWSETDVVVGTFIEGRKNSAGDMEQGAMRHRRVYTVLGTTGTEGAGTTIGGASSLHRSAHLEACGKSLLVDHQMPKMARRCTVH